MDAIGAGASGLAAAGVWMDTTASNIANAVAGSGGSPNVVSDPGSPAAGRHGPATTPGVDLSVEMPNLLMASDYFEANIAVIRSAQAAYRSVIDLGRSSAHREE